MFSFYDKQGNSIGPKEFSKLIQDESYRSVGWDVIGDVQISTVWIGLSIDNDHPKVKFATWKPMIFETRIVGGDYDGSTDRYETLEDAIEGHETMIDVVEVEFDEPS